jgi:hypothetical protein
MKTKIKRIIFGTITTVFVVAIITSCAPNVVELRKGAIFAEGGTSHPPLRGGEKIDYLDINPQKMAYEDQTNLWIQLSDGEKISFAKITRERVKAHAASEYKDPSSDSDEKAIYYKDGYAFRFNGEKLENVKIVPNCWPAQEIPAFTKIGSFSSNHVLS